MELNNPKEYLGSGLAIGYNVCRRSRGQLNKPALQTLALREERQIKYSLQLKNIKDDKAV